MCIIKIFKEGEISSKELDDLWEQNPHGAGIGLIDNCLSLKVPLRTFDKEEFKTVLTRYLQSEDYKTLVFHMRYRSRGSLDSVNINPIFIDDKTVMFHNGTLSNYSNNHYSDSLMFVFNVIHSIDGFDIENKYHIELIEHALLDNPSRLVFLQEGKEHPLIINNKGVGYWNLNKKQWSSK